MIELRTMMPAPAMKPISGRGGEERPEQEVAGKNADEGQRDRQQDRDGRYESEAAFSRAFKKAFGTAPATWGRSRSRPAVSAS
jgi:hypothetical protein